MPTPARCYPKSAAAPGHPQSPSQLPPNPQTPSPRSLGVLHWAPEQPLLLEELVDSALSGRAAGTLTPWVVCNVMWGCARLV